MTILWTADEVKQGFERLFDICEEPLILQGKSSAEQWDVGGGTRAVFYISEVYHGVDKETADPGSLWYNMLQIRDYPSPMIHRVGDTAVSSGTSIETETQESPLVWRQAALSTA